MSLRLLLHQAHHQHPGRQTKCIHIPRHDEAKVLVDFFLANLNYIYHVVHPQSLTSMVDALYAQIDKHEPVTPGRMVLLLAVIASSTHAWTTADPVGLSLSPGDAHVQAHLWIMATHDVLHAEKGSPPFSLEAALGTVVLSQPTDMSYFPQRLQLAEASRAFVNHTPMAMKTSARATHHAHVMSLAFELHQMSRDVPPFLHINNYPDTPALEMYDMFIQAYMLNSLVQTQRCDIHLEYLISGDPAYASSRETCIVLLMDACVKGGEDGDGGEVAAGLRIVGDAQDHSLAAQKLHEALVQVLARHREQAAAAAAEVAGMTRPADDMPDHQFSLETLMDADAFQLDDLFSNIDMSFF